MAAKDLKPKVKGTKVKDVVKYTAVVKDEEKTVTDTESGSESSGNGLGDVFPAAGKSADELENDFMNEGNDQDIPHLGSISTVIPTVSIVIPYLKSKAQGGELLHALRSIEKNFKHPNYNIVVVGDREDWFGDNIIHLDVPCISQNPQEDVINKIKEVLASEEVADHIVWTNDDIYFVSPVDLCDIQTLKADGNLKDDSDKNKGIYSQNRKRTIDFLKENDLPIRNFATHTPVFFEKEKFLELFETFPELHEGGYLVSSIYFNYHFADYKPARINFETDNWSLRLISQNPPVEVFKKLIVLKKFLNNSESGFSKLLKDYLNHYFGTFKSRHEA